MKTRIDQSGLLVEGDYISLSTSLKLTRNSLQDLIVQAEHKIHPSAYKALEHLCRGCTLQDWLSYCFDVGLSKDNIEEITLFINNIGGIELKRSWYGQVLHARQYARLLSWGVRPLSLSKRYPVNLLNLMRAVWRAMAILIGAVLISSVLAYGANIRLDFLIKSSLFFLFAIYITTVVHETSHALLIKRKAVSMVILRRGLRVGILHSTQTYGVELLSAIIGPLSGACTAILLGLAGNFVWPGSNMAVMMGLVVACMHMLSWLPGNGDGAVIWSRTNIYKIQEQTNE